MHVKILFKLVYRFGYWRYETTKAQGNDLGPKSSNKVWSSLYEYRPWTRALVSLLIMFKIDP